MTAQLQSLVDSGIRAQENGELEQALAFYQAARQLAPADAEVLSLLGLVLTQLNRLHEAEALLREAVSREPGQAGLRMNLCEWLIRSKLTDEARRELDFILRDNPGFAPAWERRGDLALLRADPSEALLAYSRAYRSSDNNFNVGLKLAEVHLTRHDPEQALQVLQSMASQDPQYPALFRLSCRALQAKQDWSQVAATAQTWSRIYPDDDRAWQTLAGAMLELGRYRLAERSFRKVLDLRAENAADLTIYGQICLQCFAYEQAQDAFDRAMRLEPERLELLLARSLLHTYFGEFTAAETCLQRALQLEPNNIAAYTQLGHVRRGRLADTDIDRLASLQTDSSLAPELRIDAGFTLGRAYEVQGLYDAAWQAYQVANELNREKGQREKLHYDQSAMRARTDALMSIYRQDRLPQALDAASPCPVFIVGMPRSGTTLVESSIAAHSQVCAGGERPLLPQINDLALSLARQRGLTLPSRETLLDWAASYLSDIPELGSAVYFTDKNPLNFESIGLITVLFPNAALVHVRRKPLETCLSIYRHKFSKFWTFAHRLADIAHYYGEYARLVAYWERLLGDRFLSVQYEDLAGDFSSVAPVLIRHCGLPWENDCLEFQTRRRAIATLSAVQIREPVRVSEPLSSNYRDFLHDLHAGLAAAGVDAESGSLLANY